MNILSPLEQFQITTLIPLHFLHYNISFTNGTLFLILTTVIAYTVFQISMLQATIVPNNWQYVVESLYSFVLEKLVYDLIPNKNGQQFFPFIFTLFVFILFSNELGMIPYTFTITSHLFITFSLGMMMFTAVIVVGFRTHGLHFFALFCPAGIPLAIAPLLIAIELVSFCFKVISISVRLFANVMAGHALFKILAGFAWTMLSLGFLGWIGSFTILSFIVAFTALEIVIGFIQAYIFTLLTCLYLNEAIHLH